MSIQVKGIYPDMRPVVYYEAGWENVDLIGSIVSGYSSGPGSMRKESSYLRTAISENTIAEKTWVVDIPVDLSYIKKIIINWNGQRDDYTTFYTFCISTEKMSSRAVYTKRIHHSDSFSRRDDIIDVSDLKGLYYLRAHHRANSGNRQSSNMYVHGLRGEK